MIVTEQSGSPVHFAVPGRSGGGGVGAGNGMVNGGRGAGVPPPDPPGGAAGGQSVPPSAAVFTDALAGADVAADVLAGAGVAAVTAAASRTVGFGVIGRNVLPKPAFLLSIVGTGMPIPVTTNGTATVPTLVTIDKVP